MTQAVAAEPAYRCPVCALEHDLASCPRCGCLAGESERSLPKDWVRSRDAAWKKRVQDQVLPWVRLLWQDEDKAS